MKQHPNPHATRPAVWAALTLAAAVAVGGGLSIASAQGPHQHVKAKSTKRCDSPHPCMTMTNDATGVGIQGNSEGGVGIIGTSGGSYGVEGQSGGPNPGVGGFNWDGAAGATGVYGQSLHGPGVTGYSYDGYAMYAEGDVLVDGELYTGGNCSVGCAKGRKQVAYVQRVSRPTIDDVGEAQLRDGVAHVALAADFANAIDLHKPYIVMLTPEGDTPLYVASRTASGFEVRQMGGGRGSAPFAYRIVAKPLGATEHRLPFKSFTPVVR